MMRAAECWPSAMLTSIALAPATTWLLVRMRPSEATTQTRAHAAALLAHGDVNDGRPRPLDRTHNRGRIGVDQG